MFTKCQTTVTQIRVELGVLRERGIALGDQQFGRECFCVTRSQPSWVCFFCDGADKNRVRGFVSFAMVLIKTVLMPPSQIARSLEKAI